MYRFYCLCPFHSHCLYLWHFRLRTFVPNGQDIMVQAIEPKQRKGKKKKQQQRNMRKEEESEWMRAHTKTEHSIPPEFLIIQTQKEKKELCTKFKCTARWKRIICSFFSFHFISVFFCRLLNVCECAIAILTIGISIPHVIVISYSQKSLQNSIHSCLWQWMSPTKNWERDREKANKFSIRWNAESQPKNDEIINKGTGFDAWMNLNHGHPKIK